VGRRKVSQLAAWWVRHTTLPGEELTEGKEGMDVSLIFPNPSGAT
jgi:hypothetical protein